MTNEFKLRVAAGRLISALALGSLCTLGLPAFAAEGAADAQPAASAGAAETGLAAVYSDKLHGRKTASGQIYDRNKLTAAHKTLAFGTKVKVTNNKNQKSVVVRINDRGPTQVGRVLDLSPRAARALGISKRGMAAVTVEPM
ncbi:MAG TPA: septal ring lytic transglycosylase RlpA family protein [Burkholderiales bacterium]|nr:septal ring lytic transglycosylase RlpA family protein [Burkholderiales bacterium]